MIFLFNENSKNVLSRCFLMNAEEFKTFVCKLIVRVELNFKVEFEIQLLTKLDKNLYDNFIRLLTKKCQEIESNFNLKFKIQKSRILRLI